MYEPAQESWKPDENIQGQMAQVQRIKKNDQGALCLNLHRNRGCQRECCALIDKFEQAVHIMTMAAS
jgi:hypothetical protein